jgi:hypothetical protein
MACLLAHRSQDSRQTASDAPYDNASQQSAPFPGIIETIEKLSHRHSIKDPDVS